MGHQISSMYPKPLLECRLCQHNLTNEQSTSLIRELKSQVAQSAKEEERKRILEKVVEIAKKTTFGHDDKKLGTIIAMDYQMFIKALTPLEKEGQE